METPDGTTLAQIFQKMNIQYKTWDFTENLKHFWTMSKSLLEELHQDFVTEGNEIVYKGLYPEAQEFEKVSQANLTVRFLYYATI